MIVNGQYIDYDEKAIADIQTTINKSNNLTSDLKSEIEKPRDVIDAKESWDFANQAFFDAEYSAERFETYAYFREMDRMEFIHRGLEIVADDSTQTNTDGDVMKIYSDNEKIKETLTELFVERLDMNNELWNIVYDTAKLGDNFYEVVPDDYKNPQKIIYLRYLKPDNIERIEEEGGRLSHFEFKVSGVDEREKEKNAFFRKATEQDQEIEKVYKLQPWQIVHFKVQVDRDNDPYGGSLLKSGIRTYRRLSLLEDIILVYRISRAPERRVFKINVGNMNYADAQRFVQKIKEKYRTQSFIDENGNINKKANMLSITSDIFIPVREGGQGTEVDTLQGGEALNEIKDLDYFKNKILRTMNIPLAYLGDESDRSRGSLSQMDIKFSRFIERIQSQILKGVNKIAALELFFQGFKKDDLSNFAIELTPPSNIKELVDLDLINQRMGLISTIQGLNIYSNSWILRNIMKHSDREIAEINLERQQQAEKETEDQEGMPAGGDFGGDLGGDFGEPAQLPDEEPVAGPEEEPVAVEEPAAAEEPEVASTLINMMGKDFIVENKDDFFKILKAANKYLKEEKRPRDKISLMIEHTAEIINSEVKIKSKKTTPEIRKQFIVNEMGGLSFSKDGKKQSMLLYEGTGEKTKEKKIILND